MQLPTRRSEILAQSKKGPVDNYLTKEKITRLERELLELEKSRPEAIEELRRTQEMGDLSENAAYQEAKWALRRLNNRMQSIEQKLKFAIVIQKSTDGTVQIGSSIQLEMDGKPKTFEMVGEQETDPTRGKISFKSPIGRELMNHKAGDAFQIHIQDKAVNIKIVQVN